MKPLTSNILTSVPSLNIDPLETYVQEKMMQWNIPGLSLSIVKDGKPVVVKGYGTREVGQVLPVDQHTLFPISGGTRLITASALALLVAEGQLSWDDRLVDLLPGFKTGSELINQEATLIDALACRIGLPMEKLACFANPRLSRYDLLAKLQYITKPSGFRNGQGASHLLLVAAGEIIPAVTGISWDDFVRDRLFKPLEMSSAITGPHLLKAGDNVATPHGNIGGKRATIPHAMSQNLGPASSVYCSATDMARWLQFQLDNGVLNISAEGNQVLIPQAQIDAMRKIHMASPIGLPGYVADLAGYGLGSFVLTHHTGYRVYCAGGDTEGFEAFYAFVPELNLGIAAMVNAHHSIPQRLIPWIVDRYTDAPERDWIEETLGELEDRVITSPMLKLDKLRRQLTHPSQPPSLPLDDYAGVYQHPFLGDLSIRKTGETLAFTLGEIYEGELPHANHNTFFREPIKQFYNRFLFRGPLRFNLSVEGCVESLTISEGKFHKRTA